MDERSPLLRVSSTSKNGYISRTDAEKRLVRKIDLHLMPALWIMYILNYIDRTNVGNAEVAGMDKDLFLNDSRFSWILIVFFVGYLIMEVPCNMVLSRSRPSVFLPTIMLLWGSVSVAMSRIQSYEALLVYRFILGCMESGFFPGVVYLISCWYKPAEIGTRFAIFYSASVMAGAFGGFMAGITQYLEGFGGLASWRWLFIIEGTITICVAMAAKFVLLDFPANSAALTSEERHLARIRLLPPGAEETDLDHDLTHAQAFKAVVCDYRTYLFMFLSVCIIGASTITYFVPTIIVTLGYNTLTAQYMTMPIYSSAAAILIMTAVSADRRQERRWHITVSLSMGFVAAIICMVSSNAILRYVTLCFVVAGIWTSIPLSLAWTGEVINVPAEKRAVCFALVNSVANISCIYGSQLWPASTAPHYTFGFGVTAAYLGCGVVAAALIPVFWKRFPYYVTEAERHIEERQDMRAVDIFYAGV